MTEYVTVPKEPTEDMLMAARGLIMAREMQVPNQGYSLGKVASSGYYGDRWGHILSDEERAIEAPLTKAHMAQLIYRAMLAAAPDANRDAPATGGGEPVALVRALRSLRALQEGAALALAAWPTEDGPVPDFLAAIHREAVRGQLASDGVTNECASPLDDRLADTKEGGAS